mmetsp:Transcript_7032/g.9158  ORF Transcript_7032/g.9158 Transcript_7032/m.9158 type:complete len:803 (+) Transcript_7032:90-2498(+)|eukprot:CAMPEP_0198145588 /NCGR_PEP_ID=MMETSP1443-20131203/24451_1 /TAXON_ID=186043 /ORGANISM="Entomoneis sp., Strain CCMP2396" /LENGTH=802 /DNA_ID=CAMNT_0043809279 /DNA_START=23 /DNA_END=2431 /DNA_ORIENTATION=+
MPEKSEEHGRDALHMISQETTKLLNMPFKGIKNLLEGVQGVLVKPAKRGATRFANVFAAPMDVRDMSGYKPPVFVKSDEEKDFLYHALTLNFVFADQSERELLPFINAMEKVTVEKNDVIIKQGDMGDYFYVLAQGSVSIKVGGKVVGKPLEKSASFGELALMYDCPRAATVTALDDRVTLFRVDQKTFRMIYQAEALSAEARKRELLESVDFLVSHLSDTYKQRLVDIMTLHVFSKGDYVGKKGEEATSFWIVDQGKILMTDLEVGGKTLADIEIEEGDHFGQHALISGAPIFCNVIAQSEGRAFCIDKESFIDAMGGSVESMAARSLGRKGLASVKCIHDTHLSNKILDSMIKYVKTIEFNEGDEIVRLGEETEAGLYTLHKGSVHLKNSTRDVTMDEVGMFGDDLMLLDAQTGKNGPRDTTKVKAPYTVKVTSEKVVVAVLFLKDCRKIFDTAYMGKGLPNKEDSIRALSTVSVTDFTKHAILGAGTFGQVWLVSRKNSEGQTLVYALKIQAKYELIQNHQATGVVHERQIMTSLHHPFVANLVASFKDHRFVYMLMGLVQGGELESIMHTPTANELTNEKAIFYSAGIMEGLSYMHRLGFVYRDLKPQNVLISNEGYPVIADFGFAKHVTNKTFTFCGTPLYLAPEIILNRGHNWGADHWSLGVLVFEMLTGFTPFYEESMDQMELFRAIVQDKLKFPEFPRNISSDAKSFVRGLLTKNPNKRLGAGAGGIEELYWHAWFKEIDFVRLRHKEYKAPYVPVIGDPLDTSNFEDWSGMEDKMDQKYPKLQASEEDTFAKF